MSTRYLYYTYGRIVRYYKAKIVTAQEEITLCIQLEMQSLHDGKIDSEISNRIIILDKLIKHYEEQIKRYGSYRDRISRFEEFNKEKNLRYTQNVHSGVQQDVCQGAEHTVYEHSGVSVNWGKVFKFVSEFNRDNEAPRFTGTGT
jgi:hypothetical protein